MDLIIIIVIICIIAFIIYYFINYKDMTYIKSDIDNEYYLVRNTQDKQHACNTLARIKSNILKLSNYLYKNKKKFKDYDLYIDRLYKRAPDIILVESTSDSMYTSYSINKGEQIVFCLRTRKFQNNLHNINLMMYVVLHEIAHVACPIYDNHGPLFQKIFSFLTTEAIKLKIYEKIPFNEEPEEYCGLMITESIV